MEHALWKKSNFRNFSKKRETLVHPYTIIFKELTFWEIQKKIYV